MQIENEDEIKDIRKFENSVSKLMRNEEYDHKYIASLNVIFSFFQVRKSYLAYFINKKMYCALIASIG